MQNLILSAITFLFCMPILAGSSCLEKQQESFNTKGWHVSQSSPYSSEISQKTWEAVGPYLLPYEHPARAFLDKICKKKRILASENALLKAGFHIIYKQLNQGLVVARHPYLRGYLLKMYLDRSPRKEWSLFVLRAKGAKIIQGLLDKYSYNDYMKVPQKWIYPVTVKKRPKASEGIFPKDFILIVEDMQLVSKKFDEDFYMNGISLVHVKALHKIIGKGGLSDSHIGNIPVSIDSKIAFIDTEYVHSWPVHFDWLTKYFSPTNQSYWLKLINKRH